MFFIFNVLIIVLVLFYFILIVFDSFVFLDLKDVELVEGCLEFFVYFVNEE